MTDEPPSPYAVELRPYSDKYSHTTPGEYLEIPIPDEVEELGFEHGDTVYMDFISADDPSYIRIRFSDTGTRHDLKLKHRDDLYPNHAVTFPTEYTVHRDDCPFQGFGRYETVTVEFNYGSEPEIRIYTEEGYRERTVQLLETGFNEIPEPEKLGRNAVDNRTRSLIEQGDSEPYWERERTIASRTNGGT